MHKHLNVLARDGGNRPPTQQRLDVPFDTPMINRQRGRFLLRPACQDRPALASSRYESQSSATVLALRLARLSAAGSAFCATSPSSLLACSRAVSGVQGGSMPANGEPALAPFTVAIEQHVRDGVAPLAAHTKTR
jgi:hypothetical protein